MKTQQKALIVSMVDDRTRGLDELNIALGRGWRVVHIEPMGGGGSARKEVRFASLVVIEREEDALADSVLVEEAVEETVNEGDGASQEVGSGYPESSP